MAVSIRHVGLRMVGDCQHNRGNDAKQQPHTHAQRGKQNCERHDTKRDHDEAHVPFWTGMSRLRHASFDVKCHTHGDFSACRRGSESLSPAGQGRFTMEGVLKSVRAFIRSRELLRPGERVAIAVSGGADSVALLRVLLELRQEMALVLSVAHVNHQLRGADADRDADFVADLARRHGLEFHLAERDVRTYATEHKLSLEAAGRRVRYAFFSELVEQHKADKVATAHTLDDQAETVLLKVLRGSWLRGFAGIHDQLRGQDGRVWVVRPLLGTTRREIEDYLRRLSQPWCEDLSNRDLQFRRNRVRQLLPRLEAEHNPAVRTVLAQMAELARAEESYWAEKVAEIAPRLITCCGQQALTIDADLLKTQPLALQRRLLRFAMEMEQVQLKLGFAEVERLRGLLTAHAGSRCELPSGWEARKQRSRTASSLQISRSGTGPGVGSDKPVSPRRADRISAYEYRFDVPGELPIPEAGWLIKVSLVQVTEDQAPGNLLDPKRVGTELTVRNWRPGDNYLPFGEEREKKIKVYFQQYRISSDRRTMWPLVFSNHQLVWALGMPVASAFAFRENTGLALRIEGTPFSA
jgi:tRNA(Ile)-lysidine synthase